MIKVSVDSTKLKTALIKLSKDLNKEVGDSIVEMAQLTAKQLAIRTQPYGIDKKSEDISKKAVYKDIGKSYHTVGRTYVELKKINPSIAAGYVKAVKNNNLSEAENLADKAINYNRVSYTDDGSHLESQRGNRGRVTKGIPMSITSDDGIDKIKILKTSKIGLVKSAWLMAGSIIGAKTRIPKWLKSPSPMGSGTIMKSGLQTVVTLINHVRYASELITETVVNSALANGYKNQLSKMKRQVDALASKF